MRHIYRTATILSFVLAMGSFAIDLGTFIRDNHQSSQPAQATCDSHVYEARRARLRSENASGKRESEWLGADRNYDYVYKFATDEIVCEKLKTPGPVAVSASKSDENQRPPETRFAILACLTVIGLCGAGLVVIRSMRPPRQ